METPQVPAIDQLMRQLDASPEMDVIGIVAPPGGGASYGPGPDVAYFSFHLISWRVVGSCVRSEKLRVQKSIASEADKELGKFLRPYVVARLRLKVAEQSCFPGIQALMVAAPEACTDDAELSQKAAELQIPVTMSTDRFGSFTLNRSVHWYKSNASCSWGGQPARLTLSCGDSDDDAFPEASLAKALELWEDEAKWDALVRASMVAELLPVKNESWLNEDEAELTETDFLNAVRLTSIGVDPDRSRILV